MDDRAFEVGTTAAVFVGFVAAMAVAASLGAGPWGVLAAVGGFVLAASGVGYAIAQRTYA